MAHLLPLLLACSSAPELTVEDTWAPTGDAPMDPALLLEAAQLPMRWALLMDSQAQAGRDACPQIERTLEGHVQLEGGCTDAQGVEWVGRATLWTEDGQRHYGAADFGTSERQYWGSIVAGQALHATGRASFGGGLEIRYDDHSVGDWPAWQAIDQGASASTAIQGQLNVQTPTLRSTLSLDGTLIRSEWARCETGPESGSLSLTGHPDGALTFIWYPDTCGECVDWLHGGEQGQICE